MKLREFRQRASVLAVFAAALGSAGCDVGTDPLFPIFWTGVFQPQAGAPFFVGGTTEMVANVNDTQVGIFLEAAPGEAVTVSWHVRNGTCSGVGAPVVVATAFPPVQISASGSGTGIGIIRRRLPAGNYAAEVFAGADATGAVLACANLTEG
jgi:hypothetical protein